jgi:3-phosphoglycerate kinase
MPKLSVRDVNVRSKRVLVRVDFNVPLDDKGQITDDTRIHAALPTIEYLWQNGARVILCSHLGRPNGKPDPKQSLRPVTQLLAELTHRAVAFVDQCIGDKVTNTVGIMKEGDILLLENVRFHPEEEKNDPEFARKLASNADIYVNDAFGCAHRAHASTVGVTRFVKQSAMGFLMEKELKYLQDELANPARPFLVILGGAKVSDKIGVIENLLKKANAFVIGGAMAYTFLKAQGIEVGNSLVENDKLDVAKAALANAQSKKVNFLLPVDHIVARKPEAGSEKKTTASASIESGWCGVDIGPKTIAAYKLEIARAKTIFWNGPMGIFEIPEFAQGTFEIAKAVPGSGAKSIIGGGDSVKAVKKARVADKITFISTGGGASLELMEGITLPGVAALSDKA